MAWTVELDERAAAELRNLDRGVQSRIVRFIRERLAGATEPAAVGSRLKGGFAGLWRFRVGDYRLIASLLSDSETIVILQIGHRREIYRG